MELEMLHAVDLDVKPTLPCTRRSKAECVFLSILFAVELEVLLASWRVDYLPGWASGLLLLGRGGVADLGL